MVASTIRDIEMCFVQACSWRAKKFFVPRSDQFDFDLANELRAAAAAERLLAIPNVGTVEVQQIVKHTRSIDL